MNHLDLGDLSFYGKNLSSWGWFIRLVLDG